MRLPLADPAGALGITARRQITFSSLFGVVAAPFNLLARASVSLTSTAWPQFRACHAAAKMPKLRVADHVR